MINDQPDVPAKQSPVEEDTDHEAVAQETGASKEQVAQLARVTEDDTSLGDAAAAAARWS